LADLLRLGRVVDYAVRAQVIQFSSDMYVTFNEELESIFTEQMKL